MKQFYIFIFPFIVLLMACTLNGKQESQLNNQLSRYVEAYNKSNTLVYTALTEKHVVEHYTNAGDSAFKTNFGLIKSASQTFYENPINRETKKEGNWIQRKYTVEKYTSTKEINHAYAIYALSNDNGNTWFFVNQEDYFNTKIPLKRLF